MELHYRMLLISLVASGCLSVRVTLEGGKQGTVQRKAVQGNSVTLTCNAVASVRPGTPNVEWLFDTTPVSSGTHIVYNSEVVPGYPRVSVTNSYSLTIEDIVPDDTGFYTCRVVLIGDTPSTGQAVYNFSVLVPPDDDISCGFPGDLMLTLGRPASFQCKEVEPQAMPSPTYTWFKDGLRIPPKSEGLSIESGPSYSKQSGELEFSSVIDGDVGNYYCEVSNDAATNRCQEAAIKTKEVNVGSIVGIIFAVLFALILIGVLVWWTWRRGYFEGWFDSKDHDDDAQDEGANDVMLDGAGPTVAKDPKDWSIEASKRQEASMMI